MRLKISFYPQEQFVYQEINQYFIHSFIWSLLRGTSYSDLHHKNVFKYFTFSNIFPVSDFSPEEEKHLIVSSPDKVFIKTLAQRIPHVFRLGLHQFVLKDIKQYGLKPTHVWQTATPIVLYKDNKKNIYYSYKRDQDTVFFLQRITENAIKKYNQFFPKKNALSTNLMLFDMVRIERSVARNLKKEKNEFIIIGTYATFHIVRFKKELIPLYSFLMDAGLGEKTSFGFGFINPLKG